MSWHGQLGHLRFSAMFGMAENSELPKKCISFKNKSLSCPDCTIGSIKRHSCHSKGLPGKIRKPEAEIPGGMASVDQLVLKQPGLIPLVDGRHTLDWITGATAYVDKYPDITYSHL